MKIVHLSDIHWRGIARHKEYNEVFTNLFSKLKQIKPDLIINCGDSYHTKTQGITPEIVDRLSWMFRNMADIAETYTILGNHDLNLSNLNRKSLIESIHESVNHPNSFLLTDSNVHILPKHNVCISIFSVKNKEKWKKLKPKEGYINIALYHGSVDNAVMDNGWVLEEGEERVKIFSGYDFALLGDIHKQQFVDYRECEKIITEEELETLLKTPNTEVEIIEEI